MRYVKYMLVIYDIWLFFLSTNKELSLFNYYSLLVILPAMYNQSSVCNYEEVNFFSFGLLCHF